MRDSGLLVFDCCLTAVPVRQGKHGRTGVSEAAAPTNKFIRHTFLAVSYLAADFFQIFIASPFSLS